MSKWVIAVVTTVAAGAFGLAGTAAAGIPVPGHCLSPSGFDINAAYGIEQPLVSSFCTEIPDRVPWRAHAAWITNPTHEIIPPGYQPKAAKPIDDFAKKFVRAKYVLDPGTPRQKTFIFDITQLRRARPPDAFLWASGPLRAMEEGSHVVDVYIFLWADHWDGLGVEPELHRLPAGESFFDRYTFTVE
jgi:hypothetical protein